MYKSAEGRATLVQGLDYKTIFVRITGSPNDEAVCCHCYKRREAAVENRAAYHTANREHSFQFTVNARCEEEQLLREDIDFLFFKGDVFVITAYVFKTKVWL